MREDSLQILYRLEPNPRAAFSKIDEIKHRIDLLENRMQLRTIPIRGWQLKTAIYNGFKQYDILKEWEDIDIGAKWGGDELTGFFKAKAIMPESIENSKTFLDISFGGEALLYINEKPHQGVDFDRKLVPLDKYFNAGEELDLYLEVSVRNAPYDSFRHDIRVHHVFEKADILQIDKDIEDLYYYGWLIYDIANSCEDGEYKTFIIDNLDAALRLIDFNVKELSSFKKGVMDSIRFIITTFYENKKFKKNGKLALIGQSHLDLVYLWPYKEFLRKNPRTAMNMVRAIEEFPEFKFSQSQGKLYSELKEKYPEVYEEVKKKINEGKWEPVGAFYVEPDCNLLSGESLIRQIIFGKRFYNEEFGNDPEVCWIPDVFGCMWTIPQILAKSGVKYISTIKLSVWNDTNPFPYNNFWWEGPDGSKVLAYFPSTHFVASVEPKKILAAWDNNKEKHITGESMYQFGLADGGGGATRDMVARMTRIRNFTGMPEMEFDTIINFFKRLEQKADSLPTWQDELYLETHRGTYTTKGHIKKSNRKAEFLLRTAEIYSVIAKHYGGSSKKKVLDEAWEKVLVNQFHDTIPGSHVTETFGDAMKLYAEAFEIIEKVKEESLALISREITVDSANNNIAVYNTLSWVRTDLASIVLKRDNINFKITDEVTGKAVPFFTDIIDSSSVKVTFLASGVPGIGYKVFRILEGSQDMNSELQNMKGNVFENKHFRAEFDNQGNFTLIYDKVYGRDLIEGGAANKLQIFEDRPGKYSAWDIIPSYNEFEYNDIELKELKVIEENCLRTVIRLTRRVMNSTVTQKIIFYKDIHRVDFDTYVDWREKEKLLKVAFPVSVRGRNATYDIPFGTIQRPTHESTSWDKAKFEVCAHKWADLSEADFGIALLNDCKYGYDIRKNVIRLTLLKAPIYPDPESDMGEHQFRFSLYPHSGDWRYGKVMQEAYSFNVEFDTIELKANNGSISKQAYSWIQVEGANVILETLKEPEDGGSGMVARIYDSFGQRGKAVISSQIQVKSAQEVNLMEKSERDLILEDSSVSISYKPYEIKTIRLE